MLESLSFYNSGYDAGRLHLLGELYEEIVSCLDSGKTPAEIAVILSNKITDMLLEAEEYEKSLLGATNEA